MREKEANEKRQQNPRVGNEGFGRLNKHVITTAVVPTAGYIISPTKVTIVPARRLSSLFLPFSRDPFSVLSPSFFLASFAEDDGRP